jgi:hypothetical protein
MPSVAIKPIRLYSVTLTVNFTDCPYAQCPYAERSYAECPYAECSYVKCHCAECHFCQVSLLSSLVYIVMPIADMPSVLIPSVNFLIVVAPSFDPSCDQSYKTRLSVIYSIA